MPSTAYDSYQDDVLAGNITKADTYHVILVNGYTPNKGTHTKRSDITGEVTGTGYTAGGQAIVPTFVKDTTNHKEVITFPQVTWPGSTIAATGAVYVKWRGGAATADELVCYDDFGGTVSDTAGTFTLGATVLNLGTAV